MTRLYIKVALIGPQQFNVIAYEDIFTKVRLNDCLADFSYTALWANECHFTNIGLSRVKIGCIRDQFVAIIIIIK